jgi:hypothetical protein
MGSESATPFQLTGQRACAESPVSDVTPQGSLRSARRLRHIPLRLESVVRNLAVGGFASCAVPSDGSSRQNAAPHRGHEHGLVPGVVS